MGAHGGREAGGLLLFEYLVAIEKEKAGQLPLFLSFSIIVQPGT